MSSSKSKTQGPIIDVHTHVGAEKIDVAVKIMDAAGLAALVDLNGGIGDGLEECLEAAGRHPGRFITFCRPDLSGIDEPGFGQKQVEALRHAKEAGAQGIKVAKSLGLRLRGNDGKLVAVDDTRLDPLWQTAGELGLPILIHTADPVDFWLPVDENNPSYGTLKARPNWSYYGTDIAPHRELLYQRDRVVERHRNTTFIYAHMGDAVEDLEYLSCELDKNPHLNLDTSARCNRMGRKDPKAMRDFFVKYQDRILFGTDGGANFSEEAGSAGAIEFYRRHWAFFESADEDLVPFTRDMRATGIDLPGDVLEKVKRQLGTVSRTISQAETRTRVMEGKLRSVQQLPEAEAEDLLQLPRPEQDPETDRDEH